MSWLGNFIASSIGQKLVMSLTGLFLILFLIVHLVGNLQLLADDGGQAFNLYAYFMTQGVSSNFTASQHPKGSVRGSVRSHATSSEGTCRVNLLPR